MTSEYVLLTLKSIMRYFKYRRIPKAQGKRVIIAGNGPSLKQAIDTYPEILAETPLLCVNHFADSPDFAVLKPMYYCMLDPNFFLPNLSSEREDGRNRTFNNLTKYTTWDMHLFFPCIPGQIVLEDYLRSPYIHLHSCNIYPGFTWPKIRNFVYKTGIFMPPPQNVLIAAIFEAINMGYKEIFVLGAEHSWTESIGVGNDNTLYIQNRHFSGVGTKKPMYKSAPRNTETFKVHELLHALSRTFRSYWFLREYATSCGAVVYNSTPESYIDAFDRKSLDELSHSKDSQ